MAVKRALAALICAVGSAAAVAAELQPVVREEVAPDTAHFAVRPDLRLCISPLCGGYWVKPANGLRMRCADGTVAEECYVRAIEPRPDSTGLGTTKLVKGTHSATTWAPAGGTPIQLGHLKLEVDYEAAGNTSPSDGLVVAIQDNGIVCITTPCFHIDEVAVNTGAKSQLSSVNWGNADLDADIVAWAQKQFGQREPVIVMGRRRWVFVRQSNGFFRYGRELVVEQIYRPLVPVLGAGAAHFAVRRDFRRCLWCGGYWVKPANGLRMRCADGTVAEECYVHEIEPRPDAAGLGTTKLVKGTHSAKTFPGAPGPLGRLELEVDYQAANTSPSEGAVVEIRDNGIRCFTTPCFSIDEVAVNTGAKSQLSSVNWGNADLDADIVAWAQKQFGQGEPVIVMGSYKATTGPAGEGRELVVEQIYRPIAPGCPAGYDKVDGECKTPRGCVYPELELKAFGGAPMVDPVTGEVTGTVSYSCTKTCEFPMSLDGPGRCSVALP